MLGVVVDQWAGSRSITSARLLTEYGTERMVPESTLLRGTGIGADALDDPDAEITAAQELRLVRNLVAELGDAPGLGFLAGLRYHIVAQGVWGFAVLSSPDLRAALETGARYAALSFSLAAVRLVPDGDRLSVVLDDALVPADVRGFLLERDLAALVTMRRDVFGARLPAVRVELPLAHSPVFEVIALAHVGAAVVFGAPRARLVFDAEALRMPLPQADFRTAARYRRQCDELLLRHRARLGLSGRVRQLLVRHGNVGQAEVAAELSLSVRTLRRRLAEEGTSFRELSDETFGMLAADLLGAGLTVEQVATRLRYSSASAFTAAFRSWTGRTPGQYARTCRRPS